MDLGKLYGIMAERGKTKHEVAKAIGMSDKTFYNCCKRGSFGTDDAEKMIKFLEIENPIPIFFDKLVT